MKDLTKAIVALRTATALSGIPRIPDQPRLSIRRNQVFTYVQNSNLGSVSTSSTLASFGALAFSLSESSLASSFQAIFDSFRIIQVTLRFVPQFKITTGGNYPPLLTVIDYDDNSVLTTTSQARAYDTIVETPFSNYVERTLQPRLAIAAYGGSTFSSYAQSATDWIDAASPATPWYGLKWAVDATTSAVTAAYSIDAEIIFQFKNVR
jgi:hypothetical protein